MTGSTTYLNTDLDIVSTDDLSALAAALEASGLFALHVGRREDGLWYARFEASEAHPDPETTIAAILVAAESLPAPHRDTWWACARRELNLGYQCGATPPAFTQALSSRLLGRIVAVGASLGITLYPEGADATPTAP